MDFIVQKRIWLDKDAYNKLNELSKITRGYIKRDRLCWAILYEWIKSGGGIKVGNIILGEGYFKVYCAWIPIEESMWNSFVDECHKNNFDINIGFRIALHNFIFLIDSDYNNLLRYFFE